MPAKILVLTANPADTARLQGLSAEIRDIEEGLRRAAQRERFRIVQRHALRPADLRRALLEEQPAVVHFAGHGAGAEGLLLEDEQGQSRPVSGEALAELFGLFREQVRCVVLNACYSEIQAQAIAAQVDWVAGMRQAVGDQAAREFAVAFYDALGAGRPVDFAFDYARNALHLQGTGEQHTPVLLRKADARPLDFSPTSRRVQLWAGLALAAVLGAGAWLFYPHPPEPVQETTALQILAGSVRDAAGAPLPGVTVALPAYGVSAVSDAFGQFRLEAQAPPQAEVELLAQKDGYPVHEQYAILGNTGLSFIMQEK